jgi:hypothetical protein
MAWVALNCPQCSAPLPRVAIWRSVKCPSCGALITRTESLVLRDSFRQALLRARRNLSSGGDIQCGGETYLLMDQVGKGDVSQVYLARRIGILPFLATIKLSSAPKAAAHYAREAQVLRELQASQNGAASAYCFQHLPIIVAQGVVEGDGHKHALVMSYADGKFFSRFSGPTYTSISRPWLSRNKVNTPLYLLSACYLRSRSSVMPRTRFRVSLLGGNLSQRQKRLKLGVL